MGICRGGPYAVTIESRHISVVIARTPQDVYDFAAQPSNLTQWAAGLAGAEVVPDGDAWWTDSPMGRVSFTFAPHNEFGVLDHDVTLPDGSTTHNPVRVLSHPEGAEVVFTLRLLPGVAQADFERDAQMIQDDLTQLKALLEASN